MYTSAHLANALRCASSDDDVRSIYDTYAEHIVFAAPVDTWHPAMGIAEDRFDGGQILLCRDGSYYTSLLKAVGEDESEVAYRHGHLVDDFESGLEALAAFCMASSELRSAVMGFTAQIRGLLESLDPAPARPDGPLH